MTAALLEIEDLEVIFRTRHGLLNRTRTVRAVDGVSLRVDAGGVLGLVGESGSGKSTTGRAIVGLETPVAGSIRLDGAELLGGRGGGRIRSSEVHRQIQMVFQDPYASLDPSMTVGDSIAEPIDVHERLSSADRAARVRELLELVGLPARATSRYPYEFSGGQRQRIAIARALALRPRLIVCDEAVSALDVSTQNQVINLLEDLRDQQQTAYLFIAHDLALVRHIADRVAVMYLGKIMEAGPTDLVYDSPAHPYTKALLAAIPHPVRPRRSRTELVLSGDLPDPADPPAGCVFQTRCPYVTDVCRRVAPPELPMPDGRVAACHLLTTAS